MEYRFGEFALDTDLGRLTGPDGDIVLRRQSWRLLLELLEQAPALVERDDLLDRVWGSNALSPNALPQTISELRQTLGDDARKPRYIETCHGRGYRLVCDVECQKAGKDQRSVPDQQPARFRNTAPRPSRRLLMTGGTAAVMVMAVVLWSLPDSGSGPSVPASEPEARVDALKRQAEAELDALQGDNARRSLALLASKPGLRQTPHLLTLQSRLALIDGDFEQAVYLAEAARVQAHSLDESERVVAATRVLARARERRGELEQAAEVLAATLDDRSLELDRSERFALALELAKLRRNQGRVDEAEALLAPFTARPVEVSSPE